MNLRDVLRGVLPLVLLWTGSASAQQTTTFAWDASTGLPVPDGYVLALGSQPGASDTQIDAGPNLQVTVTVPVGTWYIRAYAYVGTQFSGPSNELTLTVAGLLTDACLTDPLAVTVTQWPARKVPILYTASQPIVSVQYVKQKRTIVGAIFVDDRGCAITVLR